MELRAILIDDEQKGVDALSILIDKYIKEVRVVASITNPREGVMLIEDYKPEIVFLDINMPEMNGFELLTNLKWRDFNLVFVTAHQEYALKALKSSAIDYLLKPVDHNDLKFAIEKIRKQLQEKHLHAEKFNYYELLRSLHQEKNKIIINSRTGIESLNVQEIIALESQSNYTKIFLEGNEIISSKTLKEFEVQLCTANSSFMRIHHSFIVNLNKVVRYLKVSETIVMQNEQKIPLAKSKREIFCKWLNA